MLVIKSSVKREVTAVCQPYLANHGDVGVHLGVLFLHSGGRETVQKLVLQLYSTRHTWAVLTVQNKLLLYYGFAHRNGLLVEEISSSSC